MSCLKSRHRNPPAGGEAKQEAICLNSSIDYEADCVGRPSLAMTIIDF